MSSVPSDCSLWCVYSLTVLIKCWEGCSAPAAAKLKWGGGMGPVITSFSTSHTEEICHRVSSYCLIAWQSIAHSHWRISIFIVETLNGDLLTSNTIWQFAEPFSQQQLSSLATVTRQFKLLPQLQVLIEILDIWRMVFLTFPKSRRPKVCSHLSAFNIVCFPKNEGEKTQLIPPEPTISTHEANVSLFS